MRVTWISGTRWLMSSAILIAFAGVKTALAQYVPYGTPAQTNAQQTVAPYGAPAQPYAANTQPHAAPGNPYSAPTTQKYVAGSQPQYAPGSQSKYAAGSQPHTPTNPYASLAYRSSTEAAPVNQPAATQYYAATGADQPQAPAVSYSQQASMADYNSYSDDCNGNGCGSYNTFVGGCGVGGASAGCGVGCGGSYLGAQGRGRRWFGGFYGLYMERARNNWVPLAFSTPTPAVGYYPTDTEFVVNLRDLDDNLHGGAEVRLGSTFASRGCGPGSGCGAELAWEGAYWGLVEDAVSVQVTDLTTDANRLYGMIDFWGLEADMGAGYRPIKHYFDYGPPTTDNTAGGDIEIRSLTARSSFSVQNLEVNLLRLPILSGGAACGGSSGGCGGGGCDSGCCGTGGCGAGGGSCCCGGQRFSVTTLIGARYLRLDDDFSFTSVWENVGVSATGFATYDVQADNHLVGGHLGFNGIYRVGCSGRWALHCNSSVGVFGNHMEVSQRFGLPLAGNARYVNNGAANFDITAEDDDVAVIGELRVGTSYQYSCNWRLFGGYRVMGISGVALSFDQIPTAFMSPAQTGYVASTGSIFMHGLQAGVECTY